MYKNYREKLRIKDFIINLKWSDAKTIIKFHYKESNIKVKIELDDLNELYDKFDVSHYGFDRFFARETISIRKHSSTYDFISNRL